LTSSNEKYTTVKKSLLPYLLPLFLILSLSGWSQNATIRGFVYDTKTGEPSIFTNVYLDGTTFGAATDVNGYYSISRIPGGTYTLSVSSLGFDTTRVEVTIKDGQILNRKLYLKERAITLKTFSVSAETQEARTQTIVSVEKITPKDIEKLPSIGGEADIAQYLQVLPGVIFTGDQGGQLYIRGGSPIQNKVLLDGMIIYNPFHSIGLFSVFDTDIMRNADIYTGGFNAQYGGRISSIMDITTRDGNKNRFSGKVSASTFGAKLLLEGPLKKPTKVGGSSISYVLSGKKSYLDQSSQLFYKYVDEDGLPFSFDDIYGKISFNGSNGSKLNVFGFSFNDQVRYQAVSDLNWQNLGGGSNFVIVPPGSPVLIEGNFSYSTYDISLEETNLPARTSHIDGFNLGLDFTYFMRDNEIKYGMEVLGFGTDFTFFNELGRQLQQRENTSELAGYFKYKWTLGNLILEPSFRGHYYASLETFSPEPRFAAKYNVSNNFRLKAAGGVYSQNLISANSDRDVVNLFYGFLSGPDNLQKEFTQQNGTTRDVNHKLQKANHAILGAEMDLNKNFSLNVEGYYKNFSQLTNLNRNKIFNDDSDNLDRPDSLKKDFIIEEGNAYGIDFVLKYRSNNLSVWTVYSLSRVDRWDGNLSYNPVFDRRHNVNFLASLTFGKTRNWEASVRWNLGSGFPFTQTQGYYENYTFTEDGVNTDLTTANGDLGIQYGSLNGGRLPFYHRMDLSLKRRFVIAENSVLEANVGVTNAYDRENIFYFDRVEFERVNQLPILPSFGMSWTF